MPDSLWDKLPADLQEAIMLEGRHILARQIRDQLKHMYRPHSPGFKLEMSRFGKRPERLNLHWHFSWIYPLRDPFCQLKYGWLQESFCGHRFSGHLKGAGWFCEWILGVNCPYEKRRVRARAFSVHVCSSEREIMQASRKLIDGLLKPKHPESLWRPDRPYHLRAGPTPEQLRDDWRRKRGVYGLLKLNE